MNSSYRRICLLGLPLLIMSFLSIEFLDAATQEIVTETESEASIQLDLDKGIELLEDLFSIQTVSEQTTDGKVEDSKTNFAFLKNRDGKADVSLFTGAATYDFPIQIPPGRNGMQPSLALSYNQLSKDYDSEVGYGWSLSDNKIFRSTQKGINKLFELNDFTAQLNGSNTELVVIDSANGVYGALVEGGFLKYQFQNNAWIVTDTKGTKYFFGSTSDSRVSDPDDANKIFSWHLDRVEDTNGNFMTYTYFIDQGVAYPNTIRYTGHGENEGLFEVRFNRIAQDSKPSYRKGFLTQANWMIDTIEIVSYFTGNPVIEYEYQLVYESRNAAANLLSSVTQVSGTESLPPTNFEYYEYSNGDEGKVIHALEKVTTPLGGTYLYTYKPSSAYKTANGIKNKMPFMTQTVHTFSSQAGTSEPAYTTIYDYEGGNFYYAPQDLYQKEFAGFHIVTVTDPEGNQQKVYFHQSETSDSGELSGEFADDIAKKGYTYRTEQYDDEGNLYLVTTKKWNKRSESDDDPEKERAFVYLEKEITSDYDGNTSARHKASAFEYDTYGNQTKVIDYGEVERLNEAGDFNDILQDKITSETDYIYNTTDYLVSFPSQTIQKDYSDNIIGKSLTYYDNLPLGQIDKGNATKSETLVKLPSTYISTETIYNTYGLPVTQTNPRGYTTTTAYDVHQLYPASITNAKNHTTNFVYDILWGQPVETTDPNGAKSITLLDNFGRTVGTKVTNPANTTEELQVSQIDYDLTTRPAHTTQTNFWHHDNIETTQRTYLDGFGRTIQNRAEAEGIDMYTVQNTIYDSRGNVKKSILPVFSTGIAFETINENATGNTFTYDALNRKVTAQNPLGTTSIQFDDWSTTTTDANGNIIEHLSDARGNLIEVKEHLDSNVLSTSYQYNTLNQLEKIIDANGNEKSFTYDLLGRKLSEEVLHTANDTSFGVNTYQYDNNGNVTTATNPKNQTVNYTYDELDRLVVEDFIGETGTEATYTYDQGIYGIGKLSSVVSTGGTKSFTYDILGRLTQKDFNIDGQFFSLSFGYDIVGNLLSLTYPDSTVANYTYNSAGLLEQVSNGTSLLVSGVDYTPMGQVQTATLANGTTTTNTYNLNQLYRLTRKETEKDGSKLQDLQYTYDPVGNILSIVDASNTNSAKTTAYTYDDLYRLTNTAVTNATNGQNYTRDFTYDSIGNILTRSDVGTYTYVGGDDATSSSTNADPHSVTQAGTKVFSYDDNGNILSNGTWTYQWDYKDRLKESSDGTTTVQYTYDEGKDRLTKTNLQTNKKTFYIDQYYDLEGTTGKAHFYMGNTKIATQKTLQTQ